MIYYHFYLDICSFHVGFQFKIPDNSQQLLIMNLIIIFSKIQILKKESNSI